MGDGFIISKVLQSLLLPTSVLIAIIGFGILLIKKRPRIGRTFMAAGLGFFYLFSIEPVADALIRPLEGSYPPYKAYASSSANIVILGGGVTDLSWIGLKPAPSSHSLARLVCGITLYRRIPGSNIIISGGSGDPKKQGISEADTMKDAAVSLGVAAKDIIVESNSRNTLESALALKKIGRGRVILVTSAYHMKRAVAILNKMDMDVIAAPADYISEQRGVSFYSFIPTASNLVVSNTAISEYMSLTWYKIRGKV